MAGRLLEQSAPGEPVLLLYPPGLDFVVGFWGCLYAGRPAVPLHPPRGRQKLDRLRSVALDAGASVVLGASGTLGELADKLGRALDAGGRLTAIATDELGGEPPATAELPSIDGATLAFLQYTSGSTGDPKGVMVDHANLLANLEDLGRGWDHRPGDVIVTWLPVYHDMGLIYGTLQGVFSGATTVMMPPVAFLQRPLRWLRAISDFRATHAGGPNFAYQACVEAAADASLEGLDLSCWRMALNGAEPVRPETLERFAATFAPCGFDARAFCPGYGLAESTLKVTAVRAAERPTMLELDAAALEQHRLAPAAPEKASLRLVGCGYTELPTEIRIVDPESGREKKSDEIGEIWLAGPSVARGYWRNEEATRETFGARLAGSDQAWLRTGDLGFRHGGELFIAGRAKELIVLRGRNFWPRDLESTVQASHAALKSDGGAAFAVPGPEGEELVVAQEVRREGRRQLDHAAVVAAVRRALAEEHDVRVSRVVLLPPASLPKTSSGKIQRLLARQLFLAGDLPALAEGSPTSRRRGSEPRRGAEVEGQPAEGYEPGIRELSQSREPEGHHLSENGSEGCQPRVRALVAAALGLEPEQLDPRAPFAQYGLDSATAVRLSAKLADTLGPLGLPASLFPASLLFDRPTLERLVDHLEGREPAPPEPSPASVPDAAVVVAGLACRVPGADDPAALWRLLEEGVDPIHDGPPPAPRRLRRAGGWRPAGYLGEVARFDAELFGIAPKEAARLDPQQRLLLELTWEALESAGLAVSALAGRHVGVFVGISGRDYERLRVGDGGDAWLGTGNAASIAANRLSYTFDWRGPSVAVDTACSSSLVALHLARRSLLAGECELAVVGGVNLLLDSELTDSLGEAGMLAPGGRCRTFDAAAEGYVRAEGCVVVVLAGAAEAHRLDLPERALLLASAINQDGRSNGLTAPNGPAQTAVIREAWTQASAADPEFDPAALGYVEAHGTGTPLGDPIEIAALRRALPAERPAGPLVVGALKSNIGHLEAAAGLAGLAKAVLVLERGVIPANLHFRKANARLELGEGLELADRARPLGGRWAGISSFGFGGTNAHVVLGRRAQPEPAGKQTPLEPPFLLLPLAARDEAALGALAGRWAETLERSELEADAMMAAAGRREPQRMRRAVLVGREDAAAGGWQPALSRVCRGRAVHSGADGGAAPATPPVVGFLLSGQGSQWGGMGRELHRELPAFRAAFDRCAASFDAALPRPLAEVMFAEADPDLDRTLYTQPALFTLQVALAAQWRAWGVEPGILLGHSAGALAAVHLAGMLDLDDAARLTLRRARALENFALPGAMAALRRSAEEVAPALEPFADRLAIAAINGPRSVVVAGDEHTLEQLLARLELEPSAYRRLPVTTAFHSPAVEPALAALATIGEGLGWRSPVLPLISDHHGGLAGPELAEAGYWARHARSPVRFADAFATFRARGPGILIELGPGADLLVQARALAAEMEGPSPAAFLPSLRPPKKGRDTGLRPLAEALAGVFEAGGQVDWRGVNGDDALARSKRLPLGALPSYPFQGRSFWLPETLPEKPSPSEDLLDYTLAWREAPSRPLPAPAGGDAVRLLVPPGEDGAVAAAIAGALEKRGLRVRIAFDGEPPEPLRAVLWTMGGAPRPGRDPAARAATLAGAALTALQERRAEVAAGSPAAPIWLITVGAMAVAPGERPDPAGAALWGLGRTMAQEEPEHWGGLIDLPAGAPLDAVSAAVDHLLAPDGEDAAAFRGAGSQTRRLVSRLRPRPLAEAAPPAETLPTAALITGGLGSVGLAIGGWLVERGCRRLVLAGRRTPDEAATRAIAALRAAGAEVEVAALDVRDGAAVARLLAARPELDGLVHAAGALDSRPLADTTPEQVAELLAAKAGGAWHLHQASSGRPLRLFLLCGSIAGLWGSRDQAPYAAANTFLDALAHTRRAQGLPALALDWGPWRGSRMVDPEAAAWLARQGVALLEPAEALAGLGRLLAAGAAQGAVARVDWRRFRPLYELRGPRPLLAELGAPEGVREPASAMPASVDRAEGSPAELEDLVRGEVARALGFADPEEVDPGRGFFDQGMDSLMAVQLKTALDRALAGRLPGAGRLAQTAVFDFPTVEKLACHLTELLGLAAPRAMAATSALAAAGPGPIAVVGLACRFPGGADADAFWQFLRRGGDAVTEVPAERWDVEAIYHPDPGQPGKTMSRHGAFLPGVDLFDPAFFGISGREAESMDPQQRLLLEVAWEALENAGLDPRRLARDPAGVFVGITANDYGRLLLADPASLDGHFNTGNTLNAAAGRLAYVFGLRGPAMAVDTACSSSLVALHLACRSLAHGECRAALAAGVNLTLAPDGTIALSRAGMLARDGRCKTFDAAADGYVRGEGCGVLVLKRLADARADGDPILGLVRATAVNQDGASSGFTVPSGLAQEALLREALAAAGLGPAELDYVEVHGTGTPLGDPIELRALGAVFAERPADRPLQVGSVKTNIGHLESAAGIAGVIKTLLCLRHGELPPHLHLHEPNPVVPWHELPLRIPRELEAWPGEAGRPGRAGVSSFGASGTNAHVILEGPPAAAPAVGVDDGSWRLLTLSAKDPAALADLADRYRDLLAAEGGPPLATVAATTRRRRPSFRQRLALVARDASEAARLLAGRRGGAASAVRLGEASRRAPAPVFLFTGQGAQQPGMGRGLYRRFPVFRETLDRAAAVVDSVSPGLSLLDVLFSLEGEAAATLKNTAVAQPALVALELALAALWRSWGVEPAAVVGHSVGEIAAAHVAGILSFDDALRLATQRGRAMDELPAGGAMAALFANGAEVRGLLAGGPLEIAAINGERHQVVAGPEKAIAELLARLAGTIETRRLEVSHAFHSAAIEPALPAIAELAAGLAHHRPTLRCYPAVAGETLFHPGYWPRQARRTVDFAGALQAASRDGLRLFLELGPGRVLTGLGRRLLPGATFLASLAPGRDDEAALLEALGELHLLGLPIDELELGDGMPHAPIALPNYPFQRRRWWKPAPWRAHRAPEPSMERPPTTASPSADRQAALLAELHTLIAELLRIDAAQVDVQAPLLELGADSILLVEAVRRIEQLYGVRLSIRQFFEDLRTIEELAAYLAAKAPAAAEPAPALSLPKPAPAALAPPAPVAPVVPPAPAPLQVAPPAALAMAESPSSAAASGSLHWLMQEQLRLMGRQLELLAGAPAPAPVALATPPATAPVGAPASSAPTQAATPVGSPAPASSLPPWRIAEAGGAAHNVPEAQRRQLDELVARAGQRRGQSKAWAERHRPHLADNRASAGFRPSTKELLFPLVAEKGEGAYLWDLDGNRYVDITMGFGVHLFGHRPAFVQRALEEQLASGIPVGPQARLAGEVAAGIARLTGLERVAFLNSGTEAVMTAVRLVRAVTGRPKIALFAGSYHGHFDGVLGVPAGNGQVEPMAPGILPGAVGDLLVLDYGEGSALAAIRRHAHELAGVLVEPVQSRRPELQPREFLHELRALTRELDVPLIFDEMITGFRLHAGGAQAHYGVEADLATYGKVIGGGLPIGVVAGRAALMDAIDGGPWRYGDTSYPAASTTFVAGTFSKHPLTMAAAHAVVRHLEAQGPGLQQAVNERTEAMARRLDGLFAEHEAPVRIARAGSLFRFVFQRNYDLLFHHLLDRGVYIWEGRNCFLSTAHGEAEIDQVVSATAEALAMLSGKTGPRPTAPAPAPVAAADAGRPGFLERRKSASFTPGAEGAAQPVHRPSFEPVPRPVADLQLSLSFFGKYDAAWRADKYQLLFDAARFADDEGLAAVWLPERHFHAFGGLSPNPSVLVAALARSTRRVSLRAGSVVLPLHHPIRVAEEWSLADNLSQGRVGVAFASGWHPNDFVLRPEAYGRHRDAMFRDLEVVHALWRGEKVAQPGPHGEVTVELFPRPCQPALPTWLTIVNNPETYERAGALGAGVLTNLMGQSLDDLAANIARYRAARRGAGLPDAGGSVAVLVHTYLEDDAEAARERARAPFREYLESSIGLFKKMVASEGLDVDFDRLSDADRRYLLDRTFDRYVASSALIGSPASCLEVAAKLAAAGVDELACFVDFGVDADAVRASFPRLVELRRLLAKHAPAGLDVPVEVPVGEAQRQLWAFSYLHELGNQVYIDHLCLRFRGVIDPGALGRAWSRLLGRHQALRSDFDANGERQRIHAALPCALAERDLRVLAPAERETALAEFFAAESRRPFDLAAGPLIRATVLRLDRDTTLLAMAAHHTVIDGWSWGLISRELVQLYREENGEGEAELPQPMPWTEFVAGLAAHQASPVMAEHEAYWAEALAGHHAELALPTERSRPALRSFRGGRVAGQAPKATRDGLRIPGSTLFMTLLAAWSALLHRVAGQDDLLVGIHVGGRPLPGSEGVVGYGSYLLPLRSRRTAGATFAGHLAGLRPTLLDAFEHQDYPFERLVERWGGEGRTGLPLQVTFNLDRKVELPAPAGLVVDLHPQPIFYSRFDLSLNVIELPEGLVVELDYSADLWDEPAMQALLDAYLATLDRVAADAAMPLDVLPLPGPRRVAGEETGHPLDGLPALPFAPVHARFLALADAAPGAIALETADGRTITYGELAGQARRLAAALRRRGVGPEMVVAIAFERSPEQIAVLLGVLAAGAAYLPIDPQHPAARRHLVVKDAGARWLLAASESRAAELGPWPDGVTSLDLPSMLAQEASDAELPAIDAESLAYVLFTSGSTGRPKGVMVTHGGLARYADAALEHYPDGDAPLLSPLGFDATLTALWRPLLGGNRLLLFAEGDEVAQLAEALRQRSFGLVKCTPAHLRLLAELVGEERFEPGAVAAFVVGGEALDRATAAAALRLAPGAILFNEYGPTETVVGCTLERCGSADLAGGEPGDAVPIGRAIRGARLLVADRDGRPSRESRRGELLIGGAGLARGYAGSPARTAERFVPDPLAGRQGGGPAGARVYRSGDLVDQLPDGRLVFAGRLDGQLSLHGQRIESAEVLRPLLADPGVGAAALAIREVAGAPALVAYWTAQGEPPTAEALRERLAAQLPKNWVPAALPRLDRLPLDERGKVAIDRLPWPAPAAPPLPNTEVRLPETGIEQELAALWSEILGVDKVQPTDHFFELGGTSHQVVRMHGRLRKLFDSDKSVVELFRYTTVRELSRHLRPKGVGPPAAGAADATAERLRQAQERAARRQAALEPATVAPGAADE